MTKDQFLNRYGPAWNELRRSELFSALLETLRDSDPARSMPAVMAQSATEHAQHLLGRIAGFNLAVNLLENGIIVEDAEQEPEPAYIPEDEQPK